MSKKLPNSSKRDGKIDIRVMCPECGMGGSHPLSSAQPNCHVCEFKVLMEPANNTQIVCTWNEAKEAARLGNL